MERNPINELEEIISDLENQYAEVLAEGAPIAQLTSLWKRIQRCRIELVGLRTASLLRQGH